MSIPKSVLQQHCAIEDIPTEADRKSSSIEEQKDIVPSVKPVAKSRSRKKQKGLQEETIPKSVLQKHCLIEDVPEDKEEEVVETSSPKLPPLVEPVVEPVRIEPTRVESSHMEPLPVETPRVEPEKIAVTKGCPCIIMSGKNKGSICGRKTNPDGRCGFHRVTCVLPKSEEAVPEPVLPPTSPPKIIPSPPIPQVRSPRRESPEKSPPPVIPVETVPRRTSPSLPPQSPPKIIPSPAIPARPQQIEEVKVQITEKIQDTKCPCLIKKKGQPDRVCGKKIKQNGRCGIHQKTCHRPVEAVEAPKPQEKSPALDKDLQQLAEDLEADFAEQINLEEVKRDLEKASSPVSSVRPIRGEDKREGWTVKEQSQRELLAHIHKLSSKSVNLSDLALIDEQIIKILQK